MGNIRKFFGNDRLPAPKLPDGFFTPIIAFEFIEIKAVP
jgi:hypothetical protein